MTVAQAATFPPVTPSRTLGLLAAGIAAACAVTLGLVAALNRTPSPPAEVPAGLVLAALLLTPPAIGALGAISGRRMLLLAAGSLCLAQSVIAFSGVTLVLLLPALLFLRTGVSGAGGPGAAEPAREAPVRPVRWLALIALAVPLALIVVLKLGIFGLLPLVAFGGLAAGLRRNGALRLRPRDAIAGIAIVGFVIGAMVAAFGLTQTVCWNARQTPAGLVYERIPVRDELITFDGGTSTYGGGVSTVASGCSSGEPTIEGTALTVSLLIGAVAVSALAARAGRSARWSARSS